MFAVWQLTKELGTTMLRTLDAIKATGLPGRVVKGTRVWTAAEVQTLRAHLGGKP